MEASRSEEGVARVSWVDHVDEDDIQVNSSDKLDEEPQDLDYVVVKLGSASSKPRCPSFQQVEE